MKLRSITLCLFTACLSTVFAQNGRTTEPQSGRKGSMQAPTYSNERSWDRYERNMQMDAMESFDGVMVVTNSKNQRYSLTLRDGALTTDKTIVTRLVQDLRKASPGESFTFDLPNGSRVELVRTNTGWAPGGDNTNGEVEEDNSVATGIIWFVVAMMISAFIIT